MLRWDGMRFDGGARDMGPGGEGLTGRRFGRDGTACEWSGCRWDMCVLVRLRVWLWS